MRYSNLAELHRRQAERLGQLPAVRSRRHGLYRDLTWEGYHAHARAAAAALADAGARPGDRVGVLSENRAEWLIADMGLLAAGAVNVPPHAPLTARQVEYQLADAGVSWLFVSSRAQRDKVDAALGRLPLLRGVAAFDSDAAGGGVESWEAFLQRGRRALPRLAPELARRGLRLGPDDLATVMYTSGTTGNPKGVMLTHGNLLSNTLAVLEMAPRGLSDVVLNWLPFSHIYARTIDHYVPLAAGALLCLAESADTVVRDLGEVRPTTFAAVPRFWEKVLAAYGGPDPAAAGRRLRGMFGDRVDWMSSGGAPLPPAVARAYAEVGLLVLQGYGLTESSPVISFNSREHYKLETVGRPLPGVEVRIAPDGEVLTRGPHVMKGYWNDPAATAEAVRDGWLHTGDLGALDADGFLSITGRKKELLVLSNGVKVVPSYLEGLLQADPCIEQAVVCGEGRSYLTALLVPHWEIVARELRAEGAAADGAAQRRARDPAVLGLLELRVRAALADVSRAEQVRKFVVIPEPFSVAAEELTVSLKLRRAVVLKKYAGLLDALYRGE
jgi:long-chain acyl-CoA synthetase